MQDIADLCGVSRMTIYRHIKELRELTNTPPKEESPSSQCGIVLQMDATYWGQHFGALVARDHHSGKVLWHKHIYTHEKVEDYLEGICFFSLKWLPYNRHSL
ncbi:MAG: helix-turn-helix domain-containing protein [Paludibacteraceae bacterium]|nr:helix-turn-helix domain-containing protein [Paludibacteraceae bacterium]